MKKTAGTKKIASVEQTIALGRKAKWRDVGLSSGDVVSAETIRAYRALCVLVSKKLILKFLPVVFDAPLYLVC